MKVGLIDVDGHRFPNLALMKISAWHKSQGDQVEWWLSDMIYYDIVYMSKVFDDTYTKDVPEPYNVGQLVKGGTGYGLDNKLPYHIEHMYPDYTLYPDLTDNRAYGFMTRGCPRHCKFCIVGEKEGLQSRKVADLTEFWQCQDNITLLDPNLLACPGRIDILDQLIDSGANIDICQGLDIRLMTDDIIWRLGQMRTKRLYFAWDNANDRLDRHFKYFSDHYRRKSSSGKVVYVLTNFDSTMDDNLYRIYTLRDLGYDPYVMVYDKPHAPNDIRRLQRWCNNKRIFRVCKRFDDYK